ncbi:hypothetical protein DYB26_007878, partial [Aphanomyces astaci]
MTNDGSAWVVARNAERISGRQNWVWNIVACGLVFPGPFLGVFAFLNTVAIWNHSSAALPFGMIMILTCLFLLVNVPLTIIGGIAGRNTTTFMTIAMTYFQLVGEDHRWWWRSFWSGGVTGVFVFAYSVWYFYTSTDMDEFFQTVFYFGYSAVMSYCSLVMLAFIGSSPHHCPVSALESDGAAAPSTWSMYPSALPRVATSRLTMYNLTITDLSSFAVQALAWDAGLVAINRSGVFAWTQVYVKRQSDSMADIAATFDSFVTSPSQTTRECIGGPNGKFLRQERTDYSTFSAKVTQCAVELVSDVPDGASAMFAQDALSSTAVPVLLLRRHVGPNTNETNMAIH